MASAVGPRRPDAHLRRPPVAAVRRRPLPRGHRRHRRCSTRSCRISRDRRSDPTRPTPTSSRNARRSRRPLYEHCARGHRREPRGRRSRAAADRVRRLERRHEPGRSRGARRERLAGLVPARRARRLRPDRRGARRRARAERWRGPHAKRCDGPSSATAGTATGTAAPSSTTARRSARRPTPSAGSTRSPSRGASCRAPRTHGPRASGRWPLSSEYLVRRGDGLVLLFTPPFDHSRRRSRATSRATCPASARTAASTPTAAIWSVLAFAALGDGDKAGELFSILNPINHASTRAGVHRYKVEPYVMAGRRLRRAAARRPWRLDLVHRLGRLDVPGRRRVDPRASACAARRS